MQNNTDSTSTKIYDWIRNIIISAEHLVHIEPCEVLIKFFEKKCAEAYQVKALREALKIQVNEITKRSKKIPDADLQSKVEELFFSGDYSIPAMSEKLGV